MSDYSYIIINPLHRLIAGMLLLAFVGCSTKLQVPSPDTSLMSRELLVHAYGEWHSREVSSYIDGLLMRLVRAESLFSEKLPLSEVKSELLATASPVALTISPSLILISRGLIRSTRTEAELAFALAHELGHIRLGHLQLLTPGNSSEDLAGIESEADLHALGVVVAAGYNPYYAIQILARFSFHIPKERANLEERLARVQEGLSSTNWTPPGIASSRAFQLLQLKIGAK